MNLQAKLQQGFQVEAITHELAHELFSLSENSSSIYTSWGRTGIEQFRTYLRDAILCVRFPFGVAIAKKGSSSHIIDAHLVVWSSDIFRLRGLLFEAACQVMRSTLTHRVEVKFPSHMRALHSIMKREGFVFEGELRKYMHVDSEYIDASIYSIVR